jgi:hypothetical protein
VSERRTGTVKFLFLGLIRMYQLTISPLLGPRCRFYPSCSRYAYQAFEVHGTVHGGWLTVRRLLRCHPWNPGGIDEVPARPQGKWSPRLSSAQSQQGGCG